MPFGPKHPPEQQKQQQQKKLHEPAGVDVAGWFLKSEVSLAFTVRSVCQDRSCWQVRNLSPAHFSTGIEDFLPIQRESNCSDDEFSAHAHVKLVSVEVDIKWRGGGH